MDLWESPEALCRRAAVEGGVSSGKKRSPKNREGKMQSQKSLRKGKIMFQKATH